MHDISSTIRNEEVVEFDEECHLKLLKYMGL
jgi:hypothetical protein